MLSFRVKVIYDLCSFSTDSIEPLRSQEMEEQELGVTISNVLDDFTPSADHVDHLVTRETDSMFILTARIKGYEREHVDVLIKEDGTQIAIRTQKPFLENWKVGWKMRKAKAEVFKIPDGVILDKIKARFNEEESVVTISMPKATEGIRGIGVGEVIEKLVVEKSSILPDEKKKEQKSESSRLEKRDLVPDQVSQEKGREIPPLLVEKDLVVEGSTHDEIHRMQGKMEGEDSEREERPRGVTNPKEDTSGHQIDKIDASVLKQVTYAVQEVEGDKQRRKIGQEHKEDEKNGREKMHEEVCHDDPPKERERSLDDEANQGNKPPEKRSMICAPVIAGSAILVSVIVVVIHLIRNKNRPRKNGNSA